VSSREIHVVVNNASFYNKFNESINRTLVGAFGMAHTRSPINRSFITWEDVWQLLGYVSICSVILSVIINLKSVHQIKMY